MNSKALVTGGTGFLGNNLVRKLVSQGKKVRVLCRPTSPNFPLEDLPVEKFVGELGCVETLKRAIDGCNQVYHVAGHFEIGPYQKPLMYSSNVEGTLNLCRACADVGIERLVYTSSTNAIGYGSFNAPATEQTPYNYQSCRLPYAETKYTAEQVVRGFVSLGLPAVIVNPAFMLGAWDIKPTSGRLIITAFKAPALYYPDGGHTLIDVEDAAEGHILAMEKGKIGENYILSNQKMTYKELFTLLNSTLKLNKLVKPLPQKLAKITGGVGSFLGFFAQKNFAVNHLTVRMGYLHRYVDSYKAVHELGLPQTPIENAVAKAREWFLKYNYLH